MIKRSALTLAALFLSAASILHAQAPAGASGQCNDGTYSNAASKSGACGGHKGVKTWFAATAPAKTAAPAPASKPAPAAAAKPAPAAAAKPAATPAPAAASGAAPAGASGQCNDGTYSNAASKSGACGGHKGVKTWFAASAAPASKPAPAPAPMAAAPAPAPAPKAAPAPAPMAAPAAKSAPAAAPTAAAAPGGGPGQVWVNTETKVYHCSTDRYYGKTKKGAYMSQSDAQAKGYRPDAGKPCSN